MDGPLDHKQGIDIVLFSNFMPLAVMNSAHLGRPHRTDPNLARGSGRGEAEVLALKDESRILGQWSNPVSGSRKSQASSPWPNSTESNLFHHGETTHRVG